MLGGARRRPRATQFEALTGAAFTAFARRGVEIAVVEAGLGGRLDATNVLGRSVVQVLTNVALEHAELLGHTRELIAAEKLAVVPAGGRVVIGEAGLGGDGAAGAASRSSRSVAPTRIRTARWRGRPSRRRWAARSIRRRSSASTCPAGSRCAAVIRSRSGTAPTTRPGCSGWCRAAGPAGRPATPSPSSPRWPTRTWPPWCRCWLRRARDRRDHRRAIRARCRRTRSPRSPAAPPPSGRPRRWTPRECSPGARGRWSSAAPSTCFTTCAT